MKENNDNDSSIARKIVIFGAGKIGRSFIGQIFSRAGYEVVFVDINSQLINGLNQYGKYNVIIKSEAGNEILSIKNVRGILLEDSAKIIREIAGATLLALSVGQQGLPKAIPVIAEALIERRRRLGDQPVDFIIAENMRNADRYIKKELGQYLPPNYPFNTLVGLSETSIGKMVPIMSQLDILEDPLQVFAEPYNTLIVARRAFRNPVPCVKDLEAKDNIKAWVDRKLFIHNLGHATAAYLGYSLHPGSLYIYEVLDDPLILEATRQTMLQSADVLLALYPEEFTGSQLHAHIEDLLYRFRNKALGDTVFRVGCDLYRKLGPSDRLVAPIKAAIQLHKPFDLILASLEAALSFRARDEQGNYLPADEGFFAELGKGRSHILKNVCKLRLPG
jgi:mannitol-1-phosphate 5-dehydrogenase